MKKINLLITFIILTLTSCQNNSKGKVINTSCSTNFYETTSSLKDSNGKLLNLSTSEIKIKGNKTNNGIMSISANIWEDTDGYYIYFNIYSNKIKELKSNAQIHISDKSGKIIKLDARGGSSKKYNTFIKGKDSKEINLLKSYLFKKIELFDTSKNKTIFEKDLTFNESGKVNELFNCIYQMKNSNEI